MHIHPQLCIHLQLVSGALPSWTPWTPRAQVWSLEWRRPQSRKGSHGSLINELWVSQGLALFWYSYHKNMEPLPTALKTAAPSLTHSTWKLQKGLELKVRLPELSSPCWPRHFGQLMVLTSLALLALLVGGCGKSSLPPVPTLRKK